MHSAVAEHSTMAARHEQLVGNWLLVGRERRIERFFDCEQFVQSDDGGCMTLLLALDAQDGSGSLTFSTLSGLGAPRLHALVAFGCLLAQRVLERIPLRLLGVGDFERSFYVSKPRFDPLARQAERALAFKTLHSMPGLSMIGCGRSYGLGHCQRCARGSQTDGNKSAHN